ncbi:MAG: Fe-S cluster assembly protein SufD [Bdellovibrionales bacterium]|nr:Fe-S cluster assembly protein SufD [Bdellovibrionales bacterium]
MKLQNTQKILDSLKQSFEDLKAEGGFTEAQTVDVRERAFKALMAEGLPSTRNEFWKYTELNKHMKQPLKVVSSGKISDKELEATSSLGVNELCFVNGILQYDTTQLTEGLAVKSLSTGFSEQEVAVESQSAFTLINLAYQRDRVQLTISKGTRIEKPLEIEHVYTQVSDLVEGTQGICNTWLEIVVEEGAEVQLVESFKQSSELPLLSNNYLSVKVAKNARCEHLRLVYGAENCQHFGRGFISQDRDSFYSVTTMNAASGLTRQAYIIEQQGENAESVCNGLYLCDGSQHSDHRVVMRHLKPHGRSRQLYKGVLKGKSRSVFNGKIYIEKDAQQIDSNQLNNNLILSQGAEADSKPELEVYADDVKANHGSAIGRLDEDQLFYLMSRCLSKAEAVQYLARGFVRDVSLHLQSRALRAEAEKWILTQFSEFQKSIEEEAGVKSV